MYHYLNNPYSSHDKNHQLLVGAAIGVKAGDLERALALVDAGVDCIVVDVAHGHSSLCMEQVRLLKRELRSRPVDVIAGNVATGTEKKKKKPPRSMLTVQRTRRARPDGNGS